MPEIVQVFDVFPVSPERCYRAWLNSDEHSAFTNSPAQIDPRIGGSFTAWDGYIYGTIAILEPEHHIVQRWRTTDFAEDDEDSILDITIVPDEIGCRLILTHSHLPEGREEEFEDGWVNYYLAPMAGYFHSLSDKDQSGTTK